MVLSNKNKLNHQLGVIANFKTLAHVAHELSNGVTKGRLHHLYYAIMDVMYVGSLNEKILAGQGCLY